MKTFQVSQLLLIWAGIANATPTSWPRAVPSLNAEATAEAQQRDNTATRALSNTQIKTSDGKCLFVDKLSGDFRANLTPIQVAQCGTTDGQGWDIITKGKHINVDNSMLVVSTLTNACFNFDPRRAAGNQVLLFSCGGRADGGGLVTNSQLFAFNSSSGPLALQPENAEGKCLAVKGNVLDIADCGGNGQQFTFGGTTTDVVPTISNSTEPINNNTENGLPAVDNGSGSLRNTTGDGLPSVVPPRVNGTIPAAVQNGTTVGSGKNKNGKKNGGKKNGDKKNGRNKNIGERSTNDGTTANSEKASNVYHHMV